jgi:uncharacterized protein
MSEARLQFHAQLNDFLPRQRRQVPFTHHFDENPSIKDMIESLGVPHTEVQLILVNGKAVEFSYHVNDGDQISVYPTLMGTDHNPVSGVESPSPEDIRFVLDVHLGRLAAYLRMLGFDTLYRNDYDDEELATISSKENRVLLTRDLGLLKRSMVKHGYFIRNTNPARQLAEVLWKFNLIGVDRPFHRCLQCNGLLEVVEKEALGERLTERTRQYYNDFRICRTCDKVFWRGSHYVKMRQLIEQVLTGEVRP